jgi:hypothetical protein
VDFIEGGRVAGEICPQARGLMPGRKSRHFGNIRKLPSGRYQARYRGPDGRLRTAPSTVGRKTDAALYQHATRDRDRVIALALGNLIRQATDKPDQVSAGSQGKT